MSKWYIQWKLTQQYWSLPDAERLANGLRILGMTEADAKAGVINDWGITTDTGGGFAVSETDVTALYKALIKYRPHVSFEVTPVIPLDQHAKTLRKIAASLQSK
ncbi:MAG: hypothetical protein NWF13_02040 [Candidatus Bathyarchaeota archaeon]|nr:hypothetical protein [Candidatus Bathyarchaeota archaeon]